MSTEKSVQPNTCVQLDTSTTFVPSNYAYYKQGAANIPIRKQSDGTFRIPEGVTRIYYTEFPNINSFKIFGSYYTRNVVKKEYSIKSPTLHFSTYVPQYNDNYTYGGLFIIGDYAAAKAATSANTDAEFLLTLASMFDSHNKPMVRIAYQNTLTQVLTYSGKSDSDSSVGRLDTFSGSVDALPEGRYRLEITLTRDGNTPDDSFFGVSVCLPDSGVYPESHSHYVQWGDKTGQQTVYVDVDDFIQSDYRASDYSVYVVTKGTLNSDDTFTEPSVSNRLSFTIKCYRLGDDSGSITVGKILTDKCVWRNNQAAQYDIALYGLSERTQYTMASFYIDNDTYTWADNVINGKVSWSDVMTSNSQDEGQYTEFV